MATGRLRWAWWLLAWASLALGVVGIVVPGLPTVPFVLLSAYAAARGSKRLHAWLLAHRRFGPMIRDWQARGAVSRRAKWLATAMMALAATVMFATADPERQATPARVSFLTGGILLSTALLFLILHLLVG